MSHVVFAADVSDCDMCLVFFLMIRRPPRSTLDRSSAASDVYKRQGLDAVLSIGLGGELKEPLIVKIDRLGDIRFP